MKDLNALLEELDVLYKEFITSKLKEIYTKWNCSGTFEDWEVEAIECLKDSYDSPLNEYSDQEFADWFMGAVIEGVLEDLLKDMHEG